MSSTACPSCGRPADKIPVSEYTDRRGLRHHFHRCPCGQEWATSSGIGHSQAVSVDELLEVHRRLEIPNLTIADLLGGPEEQPA